MKRLNLCMVGVVALTLAAAPVAFAQGTTDATNQMTTTTVTDETVSGTVVSTTGDQIVVTTDAGQRMTFDKGVGFTLPGNMSVGDRVTVTYRTAGPGRYTVNNLVMAGVTPSTTTTGTTDYDRTTTTGTTTTTDEYDNTRMPRTASPLPLAGLLGLLSLGAGAGLRVLNARRAR